MQELLRQAWAQGRTGYLSALSEAKAWALREVWRSEGKGERGLMTFVAQRVTKIGGGNPQQPAISKFFAKVDNDPDWFPPSESYHPTIPPSDRPTMQRERERDNNFRTANRPQNSKQTQTEQKRATSRKRRER